MRFGYGFLPAITQDIAANYVWLKPLATKFTTSVPGAILLTDVWLYLNDLLDKRLLVKPRVPVQLQAGQEAERCKKLMGALRYLYRNSVLVDAYCHLFLMFDFHTYGCLLCLFLEPIVCTHIYMHAYVYYVGYAVINRPQCYIPNATISRQKIIQNFAVYQWAMHGAHMEICILIYHPIYTYACVFVWCTVFYKHMHTHEHTHGFFRWVLILAVTSPPMLGMTSHDHRVTSLKALLQPSPQSVVSGVSASDLVSELLGVS